MEFLLIQYLPMTLSSNVTGGIIGIFIICIAIGIMLGVALTLFVVANLITKSCNFGDETPKLSDYSSNKFASAYFGRDYGKQYDNGKVSPKE